MKIFQKGSHQSISIRVDILGLEKKYGVTNMKIAMEEYMRLRTEDGKFVEEN